MTTKVWDICVNWKYGSTDWIALKDIKKSYPIKLANFVQLHGIHEEPDLTWWVLYVERKRKTIISKLKYKYWQRMHKYGIRIPKSVKEAYAFDKETSNKLWTEGFNE